MVVRRQRTRAVAVVEPAPTSSIASRRRAIQAKKEAPKSASELIVRMNPLLARSPLRDTIQAAGRTLQANRPGHYLHVSDLLSKCIRKRGISELMDTTPPARALSLSDELTFTQGDAIHDLLKAKARDGAPEKAWGKWSCKCKSLMHEDPCTFAEIDREEVCPHCKTRVDQYHEVSMFDEELWIVGNPDMILYYANLQAFHVTELKSIADSQFKELNRPKPEHVLQVVFYWLLMHRLGYRLTDKVSIYYASKGWMFGDPTKEFVLDPQAELHRLDDMLEDARAHKASILSIQASKTKGSKVKATLPLRSFCPSAQATAAKKCELCTICFELD